MLSYQSLWHLLTLHTCIISTVACANLTLPSKVQLWGGKSSTFQTPLAVVRNVNIPQDSFQTLEPQMHPCFTATLGLFFGAAATSISHADTPVILNCWQHTLRGLQSPMLMLAESIHMLQVCRYYRRSRNNHAQLL
ncbi:hypothetical protein DFH08DRAFT_352498 [Mycena albidolilacea]|uniref:Secreted protein n=1 Tax=Mycena albidolilacea TaxID=1033008 RepID=A0AAD7EHX7_9AGAR|nr:hypothetical protein DFH08DRAFT_352498 [Mycena albidolilacea]